MQTPAAASDDGGGQTFSYHRAVAPMAWVLLVLSGLELLVVHVLLSFWSPMAAAILSALTLAGLAWLAWALWSFRRMPVLIEGDRLVMRVGPIRRVDVPLSAIAAVGGEVSRETLGVRGALNFALVAHPNVSVRLRAPIRRRRRAIVLLTHRLDDAPAFVRALERLGVGA